MTHKRGNNFLHLKEHELYIVATDVGALGFTGKIGNGVELPSRHRGPEWAEGK